MAGSPSCLVVGGGAAGLACALSLSRRGVRVTLLEASPRLGGRCLTTEIKGQLGTHELGATWLHGIEGNPAAELMRRHGLLSRPRRVEPRPPPLWLRSDAVQVDQHAVQLVRSLFHDAIRRCEEGEVECKDISVGEFLDEIWLAERDAIRDSTDSFAVLDSAWAWCHAFQCATDGCGNLHEQGVLSLQLYDELDGRNVPSDVAAGGFGAAMKALGAEAAAAGAEIRLNTRVETIQWGVCQAFASNSDEENSSLNAKGTSMWQGKTSSPSDLIEEGSSTSSGVRVVCEDGEAHFADAVCISVPLPILRKLRFDPPLPSEKVHVMDDQLRLGQVEKLFVRFKRRDCVPMDSQSDHLGSASGAPADQGAPLIEGSIDGSLSPLMRGSNSVDSSDDCSRDSNEDVLHVRSQPACVRNTTHRDERSKCAQKMANPEGSDGICESKAVTREGRSLPKAINLLWPKTAAQGITVPEGGESTEWHWAHGVYSLYAVRDDADGGGIFVAFVTGETARAVSGRPADELLAEFKQGMRSFLAQPELCEWEAIACFATSWCTNHNTAGSYSFLTPSAVPNVAEVLASPLSAARANPSANIPARCELPQTSESEVEQSSVPLPSTPQVLFCGEATSRDLFGTVGGAMLSGEREAERLVRAWRIPPLTK